MPVSTYSLKPPTVKAIQIALDGATLALIAGFVGDGTITTANQLRAVLGKNDLGQDAAVGDWVVHDVGSPGNSFRVLSNATFQATYAFVSTP